MKLILESWNQRDPWKLPGQISSLTYQGRNQEGKRPYNRDGYIFSFSVKARMCTGAHPHHHVASLCCVILLYPYSILFFADFTCSMKITWYVLVLVVFIFFLILTLHKILESHRRMWKWRSKYLGINPLFGTIQLGSSL